MSQLFTSVLAFQHQSFQCKPLFPCPYGPAQGSREQAERTVGEKLLCGLEGSLSLLRGVCVNAPRLPSHTSHSRQAEPALLPHRKVHRKPWSQEGAVHAQPWPGGREAAEADPAGLRSGSQGNGRGPSRAGLGSGGGAGRCAWWRLARVARGQGRFSFLASTHLWPVPVLSI